MGIYSLYLFILLVRYTVLGQALQSTCRCIPEDTCWPSARDWQVLNETVNGKLITTQLLADVCHDPHYNATACALLQESWSYPQAHFNSSSSFMAPYFQNQSCDPYTPRDRPCSLGNYAAYSLNVSCANDVVFALQFAGQKKVRVTVKNTGHDYLGKSAGKGSLAIWTHNLKDISFSNYSSNTYIGPAIKMGAGVQAFEAYEASKNAGLRVIGGECPTVSIPGGYTQGGGHSALSSKYGLAADQALEWEVVTAAGQHLIASSQENADMYWALTGGGGGTYGIVLSLTTKAHPDGMVGGASFAMPLALSGEPAYWAAAQNFFFSLPSIVDAGGMAMYYFIDSVFSIILTFPDASSSAVKAVLDPFVSSLTPTTYSLNITSFPTYYEHVENYFGPLPYGLIPSAQLIGGRLIPRSIVKNNISSVIAAIQRIAVLPGFSVAGVAATVSHTIADNTPASNAVLPAWRTALLSLSIPAFWNFTAPLEENNAREHVMRDIVDPLLRSIGGTGSESGTYMNEADFGQSDWRDAFYGINYERLKEVKQRYDPGELFWAKTGVGSEDWAEDGEGRLCKV